MNEKLISQFHEKALQVYENVKQATGYPATRYRTKVKKDGGLIAAKFWLKRGRKNKVPTKGFLKLVDFGRLDVSLEALVIQKPWSELFNEEELSVAKERLNRYGYFDSQTPIIQNSNSLSEELDLHNNYVEGAKTTIIINSFERDKKSRKVCIKHYGAKCYICNMSFEQLYGVKAKDFIHVHHLCPLSTIGETYQLDPIADLRPVCPNCHAVLHLQKPPYTIEEVQKMIKEKPKKRDT